MSTSLAEFRAAKDNSVALRVHALIGNRTHRREFRSILRRRPLDAPGRIADQIRDYPSVGGAGALRPPGRRTSADTAGGDCVLSFPLDVAEWHSACRSDGRPGELETCDAHRPARHRARGEIG